MKQFENGLYGAQKKNTNDSVVEKIMWYVV
jgi:hypothetical protein